MDVVVVAQPGPSTDFCGSVVSGCVYLPHQTLQPPGQETLTWLWTKTVWRYPTTARVLVAWIWLKSGIMRNILLFAVLSLLVWFTQGKMKTLKEPECKYLLVRIQLAARVLWHLHLAPLLRLRGHKEELSPGGALHGRPEVSVSTIHMMRIAYSIHQYYMY